MDRRKEIINNELSLMLSQEHMRLHPEDALIDDDEYKESRQQADEIAYRPDYHIEPSTILSRCVAYSGQDSYFYELVTEKDDEEQLKELNTITYYSSSYILLPDAIYLAGSNLVERKDALQWCEVLYALRYVPLQDAFSYSLKSHEDYENVLEAIAAERLTYPKTFLMTLFVHWFEWMVKAGNNLWSYEDKRNNHEKDEIADLLKEEARPIRDEWFRDMPVRIEQLIRQFAGLISQKILLEWSCKQHLNNDRLHNDYGAVHDQCLKKIWEVLSSMIDVKSIRPETVNLNYLMLVAKDAIEQTDSSLAKDVYDDIKECLLKENFSNMGAWSEVDVERQQTILKLMKVLHTGFNAEDIINDVTIKADGWNVDYQKVFETTRREAYIVCCLLRQFEESEKDEHKRFDNWKHVIDTFVRDYRRCDNEFIANDEFSAPLKVAVEVAEKYLDEQCREYLHELLLKEVLNIVSLLTIFSVCSLHLSNVTITGLLNRIDVEWPSAQLLMETRGQREMKKRIEELITQLRGFVKE